MESFARAFREADIGQRNARHLQQPYEKPPDQLFDPLVRKKCASLPLLAAMISLAVSLKLMQMESIGHKVICSCWERRLSTD